MIWVKLPLIHNDYFCSDGKITVKAFMGPSQHRTKLHSKIVLWLRVGVLLCA